MSTATEGSARRQDRYQPHWQPTLYGHQFQATTDEGHEGYRNMANFGDRQPALGPFKNGLSSVWARQALSYGRALETLRLAPIVRQLKWPKTTGLTEIYPANLTRCSRFLYQIDAVLSDGIPLYGIPRVEISQELIDADTSRDRREIIWRRRLLIVNDCTEILERTTSQIVRYETSALAEAIAAMQSGHWRASQALAATTADSLMWRWRDSNRPDWNLVTRKRRGALDIEIENLQVRAYIALKPVHVAHTEFWPSKGTPIPRAFNRHATLHRVSRQQYSKRNAVICLMLATSLVEFMSDPERGLPSSASRLRAKSPVSPPECQ